MDPLQALAYLDQIAAGVRMSRDEHHAAIEASRTIRAALEAAASEPAEEPEASDAAE